MRSSLNSIVDKFDDALGLTGEEIESTADHGSALCHYGRPRSWKLRLTNKEQDVQLALRCKLKWSDILQH